MRLPRRRWLILIGLSIAIKLFSLFPYAVERYYSNGFYPLISSCLRFLLGWIPFSAGDILYVLAGIWLLRALWQFFSRLFRKQLTRRVFATMTIKFAYGTLVIYVIFNLFWGLNYNRVPMMKTLGLDASPYTTAELRKLTELIIIQTNSFDSSGRSGRKLLLKKRYLFNEAIKAYRSTAVFDPTLTYRPPSVKPSLFSYLGNYLGFTGYYNPFSGEAQSNTTVPAFVQPFTTCHEIGHQLGYAKENEANFAGFLSARHSPNPAFQYSLYFDMLSYSLREMQLRDSLQAKELKAKLNPGVLGDFRELKLFYQRYDNMIEPVIRVLYSNYLRANDQPQGMKTYNQVVAMMMAYYRRYGKV
jgi:hypothetical protein